MTFIDRNFIEGGGETVTYPKQRALQNVIQAGLCQGPT
jgi:hypothetical protein